MSSQKIITRRRSYRLSVVLPTPGLDIACVNQDAMYRKKVKTQMERNPCLANLHDFLSQPGAQRRHSRIVSLDFVARNKSPTCRWIQSADLPSEMQTFGTPGTASSTLGQILILEDISAEEIEILGSSLNLDPMFFASYIRQAWHNLRAQDPQACTLPSRERSLNFLSLYYHRTVVTHGLDLDMAQLVRACNHQRKLFVLSPIKGKRVGLAQHACVVTRVVRADGRFLGIILADPPFQDWTDYVPMRSRSHSRLPKDFSITPFLGGCEDFRDNTTQQDSTVTVPLKNGANNNYKTQSDRRGILDELVYYWMSASIPALAMLEASTPPSLQALAYLPLRIVAAEWVNYITLIDFSLKEFEWHGSDGRVSSTRLVTPPVDWTDKLDALDTRLRALQTWRRRVMASTRKMRQVARFLDRPAPGMDDTSCNDTSYFPCRNKSGGTMPCRHEAGVAWAALKEDYVALATEITDHAARLESTIPVVTTGMTILESRRALAEATNVGRLTVLAFFFLPLTFVAGLFSIDGSYGPSGSQFWVYWAVAIPLMTLAMLLARPPTRITMILKNLETWLSKGPWRK